jgi:hypothetical protein
MSERPHEVIYVRVPAYLRAALIQESERQDEPVSVTLRRLLREKLNVTPPVREVAN